MLIKTREELLDLVPKNSICAEIGVFTGDFSNYIFNVINPSKFYLVDIFEGIMVSGDKNGENIKEILLEDSYRDLQQKYANTPEVELYKGTSEKFLNSIPDGHLDFIYIDGDHGYEGCKLDLELARHKVKPNGIIAGHDYCDIFLGVTNAVNEFILTNNLKDVLLTTEDKCSSYFIRNVF